MLRIYDMKQKEVINVTDGCRYGYVCDIAIDVDDGKVLKIIVPCPGKLFGLFGPQQEYHIPWCDIKCIGDDIILVESETKKIIVSCD